MPTISFRSEAFARGARMLRTAMGPAVAQYLEDPSVVEVMLNPDGRLWIDRLSGGLEDTGGRVTAADAERIVRLVAHHVGVEVHPGAPRVSAELPETGERFEGLVPPVVAAPCFAIRRPAVAVFTLHDYVDAGIMSALHAELLQAAVRERKNILIAGGTSTGKTTLVNALLAEVAKTGDRVVLIEDTRELQCAAPNLVALRTKDGAASLSDLVRSALRLRPDRIPIGEVRGAEALDLLKAWGTGHPGGVGTLHAGSAIRAAALACGGDWHDLGGALSEESPSPSPCSRSRGSTRPLSAPGRPNGLRLCSPARRSTVTPELKEHLWTALTSLASAPVQERTITGLAVLLQSNALKQALQPYTIGGPWGRLLDAEAERLGEADVQAFETEGLIGAGAAPAVLAYLFHRIEDRLDGRPTLIIIDEGWLALDDRGFSGQLREWLKTLRKKNASVVFATQSLADIDGSAIAPAIIESCPTRIFLPNERALEPQIAAIYRRFGLNDRQIEILSRVDAEARLLLPVPPRQSAVRARPLRGRARLRRRLIQDRPGRDRRDRRRRGS